MRPESGAKSAATTVLAVRATLNAPVVMPRSPMRSTATTAGAMIGNGPSTIVATSTKFRPKRCIGPSPVAATSSGAPVVALGASPVRIAAHPMAAVPQMRIDGIGHRRPPFAHDDGERLTGLLSELQAAGRD